ncbi:hypothetical protein ACJMK2_019830 [Sinanodonta woodiana]|uniref:SAM domain-containing protein n=1 Tax=Sinanodonta woodiana TaxID=1069815 RepID=A0ABD3TX33_SINWO
MAAGCNTDMLSVLKKVGLEEYAGNFDKLKVSPDIVCFLSAQELHELGLSRKEEMVKLRMECIKYGANRLQRRSNKSGPPEFVIPKCILQNLIDDGFLISDIAKLLTVSESAVYRRMRQYHISKAEFSNMNDDKIDLVDYGAEGITDTSADDTVEDARPVFNSPGYNLSIQCRQHLETDIHADWVSHNFGIDIYLKALDIIRIHSNDV